MSNGGMKDAAELIGKLVDGVTSVTQEDRDAFRARMEREAMEEQLREREAQRQRANEARLRRAGIPKRYEHATLESFEERTPQHAKAKNVALDYVERFAEHASAGRCLLFVGNAGTGKTHLACGIIREVCNGGKSAEYRRVSDVIRMIRGCWRRDSDITEMQMIDAMRAPDLLVLDEVGVQYGTDGERAHLFDIIDGRYMDMKPTIVVSNCTKAAELADYLGERALDRLRENGGTMILFDGKSRRGEK